MSGAGFIPYVGVVTDLADAGIYSYRGMGAEAAISAVSTIPGLGDAVGLAYKAAKGIKAGAQVVGTTFRQVAKLLQRHASDRSTKPARSGWRSMYRSAVSRRSFFVVCVVEPSHSSLPKFDRWGVLADIQRLDNV